MRILILNPNSDQETGALLQRSADAFLKGRVQADVVSMVNAPRLVVTYADQAASATELAEIIRQRWDNYDAFVLACHADPNLDLVREVANGKPVFGIAEASMRMAAMMAGGYAVLTPSPAIIPKKFALARKYHCEEQLKTVQVSKGDSWEELLEAAQRAVEVPGVGAIVLGCANYSGADGYLEKKLGVPVFDGLIWALILAEGAVRSREYQKENS